MQFLQVVLIVVFIGYVTGTPPVIQDCVCGEANIYNSGRIVHGKKTEPNKYPWMAAMYAAKGGFMCGGSVISTKNILTAGHCLFYANNPLGSTWYLGMHNSKIRDGVMYTVQSFELHPMFVNDSMFDNYDMSIVTVDQQIEFNHVILPICMPTSYTNLIGKMVTVAGWGKLGEGRSAQLATVLMETQVWLKSDAECVRMIGNTGIKFNSNSMICAHKPNTDACQGDSGGPLFIENEPNRHEILGTVSFGDGCARDFPGIYAKVFTPFTLGWIDSYIERSGGAICSDPTRFDSRSFHPVVSGFIQPFKPIIKPLIKPVYYG